jgi:hypothetical protein
VAGFGLVSFISIPPFNSARLSAATIYRRNRNKCRLSEVTDFSVGYGSRGIKTQQAETEKKEDTPREKIRQRAGQHVQREDLPFFGE